MSLKSPIRSSLLHPVVKSFLPCLHPVVVVASFLLLLTSHTSPVGGGDVIRLPLHTAVGRETWGPKVGETETANGRQAREDEGATQQMEGISGEGYFLNISVGTPPQQMQILVDTGSSNTALAASPNPHITHYFNSSMSSTYYDSGEPIHVPYTQGEWNGNLGSDLVTLTSLPGVKFRANLAFITQSQGFFIPDSNWQGILGLAYQSIARPDTLTPFWDSLRESSNLSDVFSMQLCGAAHSHNASASGPSMEGNLVFGGVSDDLYTGEIFYTPIVKEMYYEVVITDMAVQGKSLNFECKEYNFDKTIVDSGTTHLRLPTRVFDEVVKRIRNSLEDSVVEGLIPGDFWSGDGFICWDDLTAALALFPSLSISLLSTLKHDSYFTLQLTSQHYLRRVDNVSVGFMAPPQTCLKLGISPSDSGSVLGAVLMESYYVVFDREHRCVGFADTTCPPPSPLSHIPQPHISQVHTSKANLTACQYQRAITDDSMLQVVSYVMGAVCVVCALPLLLAVLHWQLKKFKNGRNARHDRHHHHDDTETVLTNGM